MADLLWTTRVFSSATSAGWSVGVVQGARDPALLAEALGFDQTIVVSGERHVAAASGDGHTVDVPLTGLLAAGAVLQTGEEWVTCPDDDADLRSPAAPLASALGRDPAGLFPEWILPARRRRYYRRVASVAALELIHLPPENAWSYLRHEGLSDVCLYADGPAGLHVRVFSRRRVGRESRAAPLVVAGLARCLRAEGVDAFDITIQQGHGPRRNRSTLRLRQELRGPLQLGGRVEVLGRGELLTDLGRLERVA